MTRVAPPIDDLLAWFLAKMRVTAALNAAVRAAPGDNIAEAIGHSGGAVRAATQEIEDLAALVSKRSDAEIKAFCAAAFAIAQRARFREAEAPDELIEMAVGPARAADPELFRLLEQHEEAFVSSLAALSVDDDDDDDDDDSE